ncbi:fimbrillin family protein [Octadecabacter sp. 1_MG-2023]|uniref:fimbrillin family protein n=1 Tax=unclassified Octadecabacter TaxID=196158 RepID=UPI001C0970AB|nr:MULTISPECIES: fimbrillin family protein [unclassified Octadecabacter]MBU2993661.1 fimbrillin family protein [Octadecabacter sp. B2R22]MDO6735495.1 fimbrillin family protein [Octadecabacter sp. 1_MG-2023]
MIRTTALLALCTLSACSGEMVTNVMPGEAITVNGNAFTVIETSRGVTVQNFETGRTNPAVLIVNAGLAAERVTGCTVEDIVKDGITNTYYASMACPE